MDEVEPPTHFTFDRAVNEVFHFLPPEVCPCVQSASKRKFEGFLSSSTDPPEASDHCHLPMAPAVQQLVSSLEDLPTKLDSSGRFVPHSILSKGMDFHWGAYRFSKETFPLNVPPLDEDASRLSLRNPSSLKVPAKLFSKWELRARQLLGIASYNNAFSAALHMGLKDSFA